MSNEPLADVRDMYLAHIMFRRETGLGAELIRGVADGDLERAAIVADHLLLVDSVLEHHHVAEDKHIWPRLLERAGGDVEDVVRVMEEQHGEIDALVEQLRTGLADWRGSAHPGRGDALADTVDRLHERLVVHLDTEEARAVPLIERHVTAAEWGAMISDGAEDVDPAMMPLMFGLMAYEGDPDTVRDIIAGMPPEVSSVIGDLADQAYAEYALRVHGTATPERIGSTR
jgi:hypothetical protein